MNPSNTSTQELETWGTKFGVLTHPFLRIDEIQQPYKNLNQVW